MLNLMQLKARLVLRRKVAMRATMLITVMPGESSSKLSMTVFCMGRIEMKLKILQQSCLGLVQKSHL